MDFKEELKAIKDKILEISDKIEQIESNIAKNTMDINKQAPLMHEPKMIKDLRFKVEMPKSQSYVKVDGGTIGDWEEWANLFYQDYPTLRKYLPAWFLKHKEGQA